MTIAAAAAEALALGPVALVTILATEGSAPRGAGTRMLVGAETLVGTIGGGALEWRAAEQARLILDRPPGSWRAQDYPLGPLLGQCCGGRVRLLIERLGDTAWLAAIERGEPLTTTLTDAGPARRSGMHDDGPITARGPVPVAGFSYAEPIDTARRPVMLFGAGHVGRAIARLVPGLPLSLAWFDSRRDADAPGVVIQDEDALVACAADARDDAAVLVLTHDHGLDYRLIAAALASPAGFVGLIGSATKRARFVRRLREDGIDPARLTCPIGAAGVTGKEPGVIAIAAVAQLLAMRKEAA